MQQKNRGKIRGVVVCIKFIYDLFLTLVHFIWTILTQKPRFVASMTPGLWSSAIIGSQGLIQNRTSIHVNGVG